MRKLIRDIVIMGKKPVSSPWLTGGIPAANCIAAYNAKGAASLAASYINLANPGTYDLTEGAAPTWDVDNGWKGATGKYLKTGFTAVAGTWSAIVRFTTATSIRQPFGCSTANKQWFVIPNYAFASTRYTIIATVRVTTPHAVDGVVAISGLQGYKEGIADGDPVTGDPIATDEIYILAPNNAGTPGTSYVGYVQAIWFYDIPIAPYIVGLTAAINAL